MMLSWALALLCFTLVSAEQLKLTDCNKSGRPSYVKIRKFDLSPQPVPIPGKLTFDVVADLEKNLTDVSMSVQFIRNTFFLDVTLPCKDHIGSCDYPKVCSLFTDMIAEDWGGIGRTIGTQFDKNTGGEILKMDLCKNGLSARRIDAKFSIDIPELPALLKFIAAGDYTIRVNMIDNTDGSTIVCTDAEVELVDGADDGGFIFGKRRRR